MKTEIKQRWLDALKTYKQTKEMLRGDGGFCCLGVLCDLSVQDGVGSWQFPDNPEAFLEFCTERDSTDAILPHGVETWAGLEDCNGNLPFADRYGNVLSLAMANDHGCNFAQISDLIKHFF